MKENRVEHFGISRKIISNMTCESWETIPHVCLTYEPEVTEALSILHQINEDRNDATKFTINTAILKIIVEGLKSCPKMNGHIQFHRKFLRGEIETMTNIDITMPIVLDSGEMMTLNMHGMEHKSMSQMRDAIADSMRRASNSNMTEVLLEVSKDNTIQGLKKGKIMQAVNRFIGLKFGKSKVHTLRKCEKKNYDRIPSTERLTKYDLEVGTITVSNMGSIYKDWRGVCTLLEIIPPQLVAIAVGAIQDRAVVDQDGTIRLAKALPFTIAFDHRALDMGDIVPFMKKLDQIFREPQILYDYI